MLRSKASRAWVKPERQPLVVPDQPPVVRGVITASPQTTVVAPKDEPLRSEAYRRYVAEQECFMCRVQGFSQCAHENFGKAMSRKVCDSRTFPACGPHWGMPGCHQAFDLAFDGLSRDERRELGAKLVAEMQARAVSAGWDIATLRRKG
jgi:hypothetical protein